MSTAGGLIFLFAGIALFLIGIILMAVREMRQSQGRGAVVSFRRSRRALYKIFSSSRGTGGHDSSKRKRRSA